MIAPHAADHTVIVRDKAYLITVYRESEDVWIATGDYMGQRIEAIASSPADAERHWVRAAYRQATE
jgi:hypothetical protein